MYASIHVLLLERRAVPSLSKYASHSSFSVWDRAVVEGTGEQRAMADSDAGKEIYKKKLEAFCSARNNKSSKIRQKVYIFGPHFKKESIGPSSRAATGQNWNDSSNKMNSIRSYSKG